MKKLILTVLFTTLMYATQVDVENLDLIYVDKEGKPFTGEVFSNKDENKSVFTIENGKMNGTFKIYDEDGKLSIKGTFKDGSIDDDYEIYFKNGKLDSKYKYKNRVLNGPYEIYYENGSILEKGTYKNGALDGEYNEYYENGKLFLKSTYKNGVLNGPYEVYYENGSIMEKVTYKNDLLDGEYKRYYETGKLLVKAMYENGKLVGNYEKYYENGKLLLKAICENDGLSGVYEYYENYELSGVYEYYENDELPIKSTFIDLWFVNNYEDYFEWKINSRDKYKIVFFNGPYELYYENGSIMVKGTYKNYLLNGEYKEYYENGQLSKKAIYKDGMLDGLYENYYENGNIKYKTFYEEDEILSKEYIYNERGELIKIVGLEESEEDAEMNKMMNSLGADVLKFLTASFEYLKTIGNLEFNKYELIDNREITIVTKKIGKVYIKYEIEYPKARIEIFKDDKKTGDIKLNFNGDNDIYFEMDGVKFLIELLYNNNKDKYDKLKYNIDSEEGKVYLNYNEYGLNGMQKGYYSNGKIHFEVEMTNGYLNGIYKEYDENGKLIKNEKYKDGELVK